MEAVVIGASSESLYAINCAKSLGFSVIAFDGNKNAPGLESADMAFVVDITKPDLVVDILKRYNPDIILPIPIGRYLTTIGYVNDYFNLPGVRYDSALKCTDKFIFHSLLNEKDLRPVDMILLRANETSLPFKEIRGMLPVVVKPRFGSGSRGVKTFFEFDTFLNEFANYMPYEEDYCIESYVDGDEYGVDGIFDNGVFQLVLLRGKINTPLPYRECVGYYSLRQNSDNFVFYDSVSDLIQNTGKILGFDNVIIHADIIKNSINNEPFLIEISARPSGHNLHSYFTPLVTGVDMVTEFVKKAVPSLSMPYSFEANVKEDYMIRYFDFEDVLIKQVPNKDYVMEKYPIIDWNCHLESGMRLGKVTNGASIMSRGFYSICADSLNDLISITESVRKEFITERIL
ncbi:MAG: ATP-grasp domain-containing protein [Lachnospiraceae bacterium]|nr:ATP-grasp domain-containing protein [Lachnospiraceae bacterium]